MQEREHAKLVLASSLLTTDEEIKIVQVGEVRMVRKASRRGGWQCSTLQIAMKNLEGVLNCVLTVTGIAEPMKISVGNQVLVPCVLAEMARAMGKTRCSKDSCYLFVAPIHLKCVPHLCKPFKRVLDLLGIRWSLTSGHSN